MKSLHPKSMREVLLLVGVTALALVPIFFLWRKSQVGRGYVSPRTNAAFQYPPLFANSAGSASAYLSPDGCWVARREVPASLLNKTSAPGTPRPKPDELVIRSARTGKEVFRAVGVGGFVGWIPNSLAFVTQAAGDMNIFAPTIRKPGASSSQPWSQKTVSFPITPDEDQSEMQDGTFAFSSDLRYVVKSVWGDGRIKWQVIDLKMGQVFPTVRVGTWLGTDVRRSGYERYTRISVAPASLSSGGRPVVAVLQSKASPPPVFPTSIPYSTPGPTPTYSALQMQIKAKEDKEMAETQKLVDSVMGVDGSEPEVTDEKEVARISAEVKRRNAALYAEQRYYFPQSTPKPTTTPRMSLWEYVKPFQLEVFDLSTGKRLWVSSVQGDIGPPSIRFSPDGGALIAMGTSALTHQNGIEQVTQVGVDFLNARTGHVLKKTSLYGVNAINVDDRPFAFYLAPPAAGQKMGQSVFAIEDSYTGLKMPDGTLEAGQQASVFCFFYPASGREIGYLKMDGARFPANVRSDTSFSVSQSGQTWLLGNDTVFVVTRKQLGQLTHGPFPLPIPTPFSQPYKHPPGGR